MKWIAVALLVLWSTSASATDCPARPRLGAPLVGGSQSTTSVCHAGYEALVDDSARVPLWVAYELTGPHVLGCLQRKNNFHADAALPADGARPGDYAKSGYDLGHQAPAEDFSWSADELSDSFSMANMAPQVPGLNRRQWERLEETVRAWALERGPLTVYVGPVLADGAKTINRRVAVPSGFWKVVVDRDDGALAFYMDNRSIPKGDLAPFMDPAGKAERSAGVTLPLASPPQPAIWAADLTALRKARAKSCAK